MCTNMEIYPPKKYKAKNIKLIKQLSNYFLIFLIE